MRALILVLLFVGTAANAAKTTAGIVQLTEDTSWYVEHRPAARGQPTLFLVNGLTWSTQNWDAFVAAMDKIRPGLGLVRFDMTGMGQTLLNDSPPLISYPIHILEELLLPASISLREQAANIRLLKDKLGIRGKTALAGLSYGGAVSLNAAELFPGEFDQTIVMAPLLHPVAALDEAVKTLVRTHKTMYPLDPRDDDELYNRYLWFMIYTTFPREEPAVLDNPYKLSGIYRMSAGAKTWDAAKHVRGLSNKSLYVIGAMDDEYVSDAEMNEYWKSVPKSARASYIRVRNSKHRLPELEPALIAGLINEILDENPQLAKGLTWEADPKTLKLTSGNIEIPIKTQRRMTFCESLLRTFLGKR